MAGFRLFRMAIGCGLIYWGCVHAGLVSSCNVPVLASNPLSTVMSSSATIHYAPAEDLEAFDYAQVQTATSHLDVAMYAFTDRRLAAQLKSLAQLGVVVRLYRDGEQFAEEQQRGNSTTDMLRGQANIHIRVKPASREYLMHLKAYSDGKFLRDGSANWSVAGLRKQDNSLTITTDSDRVGAFERDFDSMWERSNNFEVQ